MLTDMESARITLVMIGKLGIASTVLTMYPFSAEIFPTVLRNSGLGLCSMAARTGGLIAPFIDILVCETKVPCGIM